MEKTKQGIPEVLTVYELAEYLGLHPKTVYTYIAEGRIRAIRCGRCYRIRREWVEDYIRSASPKGASKD